MKIRAKLYISYAVMVLGIVIMAIYGVYQLKNVNDMSTNIVETNFPRVNTMTRIDVDISDYRGYALNHVIAQDQATKQQYEQKMAEGKKTIDANLSKYHDMTTMRDKVEKLQGEWSQYASVTE